MGPSGHIHVLFNPHVTPENFFGKDACIVVQIIMLYTIAEFKITSPDSNQSYIEKLQHKVKKSRGHLGLMELETYGDLWSIALPLSYGHVV